MSYYHYFFITYHIVSFLFIYLSLFLLFDLFFFWKGLRSFWTQWGLLGLLFLTQIWLESKPKTHSNRFGPTPSSCAHWAFCTGPTPFMHVEGPRWGRAKASSRNRWFYRRNSHRKLLRMRLKSPTKTFKFVDENKDHAGFVSRLETHSITKQAWLRSHTSAGPQAHTPCRTTPGCH